MTQVNDQPGMVIHPFLFQGWAGAEEDPGFEALQQSCTPWQEADEKLLFLLVKNTICEPCHLSSTANLL